MTEPCHRRAWLTLGSLSVDLEDYDGGWFCTSLDLGYPEVRDVVNNRPDQQGIDDRTQYFGGRPVTAALTAIAGAGATIDAVAAMFAPFMVASARPTLHYVLDRPGYPERVINNLRAAGFAWPVEGPYQRDIQLQWVAPDPAALDPVQKTATAWAGSSTPPGRAYPLAFNRIYPPGSSSPTTATVVNSGDLPLRPLLRIYGPVTAPNVRLAGTGMSASNIYFQAGYLISAGQWVDVDTAAKTAYVNSDPASSAATAIDWQNSTWPIIPAHVTAFLQLFGSSTSGVSQVQAFWQDAYLS